MMEVLKQQYDFIKVTRQTLFTFLEEIPAQQLHETVHGFGRSSILRTHIHAADCYRYWLGSFAAGQKRRDFAFTSDEEIEHATVITAREKFELVDDIVERFLTEFQSRWFERIANEVKWQEEPWVTTPLWLLTHAETHEFHHKGQIVSMARILGYAPPDTDLAEPVL